MLESRRAGLAKPHLWLIRVIGVIVPRRLRANWRQEWEAELRSREALLAEWDKLNWKNSNPASEPQQRGRNWKRSLRSAFKIIRKNMIAI
jgi:hypothetical protein